MIRRPPRSTLFPYHDALPILPADLGVLLRRAEPLARDRHEDRRDLLAAVELLARHGRRGDQPGDVGARVGDRSEEHTSELQSRQYLVCRLLLEKKNIYTLFHL